MWSRQPAPPWCSLGGAGGTSHVFPINVTFDDTGSNTRAINLLGTLSPASVNVAANASLNYTRGFTSALVAYSRGVNAGSGVQTGSRADTIVAGWSRSYGPDWAVGTTLSYSRTVGLALTGVTQGIYGGVQVSRRLTSSLSMFVSYTGIHQSIPSSLSGGAAYSGFSQSGAIGITFAPRAKRLGQL